MLRVKRLLQAGYFHHFDLSATRAAFAALPAAVGTAPGLASACQVTEAEDRSQSAPAECLSGSKVPSKQPNASLIYGAPSSSPLAASIASFIGVPGQLSQQRHFSRALRYQRKFQRKGALSVRGRDVDAARQGPPKAAASKDLLPSSDRERPGVAGADSDDSVAATGAGDSIQPLETKASENEVANIVRHPALLVTRDIEWGTVILGFEQANKYTVLDQDGNVVALLAEDMGGFGKEAGRQLLRTRRNFTATILSPSGQVILRLRRPMYLINSTIYVDDGAGEQVGEVRQRFHLWQRNYDIYLGRRQVATINSPLLAWEFALRDESGGVLALIDRNFSGFGRELFTDAGKYVIHFGDAPDEAARQAANTVAAAHPDKPRPKVTALAKARTDVSVIPTSTGDQLEVVRPLSLDERTLALAAAISIDFDYFSQHSHGSGILPHFLMPYPGVPPVPYPGGGAEGEAPEGAPSADGEAPAGAPTAGAGTTPEPGFGDSPEGVQPGSSPDLDLGDDSFQIPSQSDSDRLDDILEGDDGSWGEDSAGWTREGTEDSGEAGASAWDLVREIFGNDD